MQGKAVAGVAHSEDTAMANRGTNANSKISVSPLADVSVPISVNKNHVLPRRTVIIIRNFNGKPSFIFF